MHPLKLALGGITLLALALVAARWRGGRTAGRASGPVDADHVTLVSRSVSPSGARHALLIRRYSSRVTNDLYLVAVGPARDPVDAAALRRFGRDSAALFATRADRLRLEWSSDTELVVVCDRCGVASIDIVESHDRAGGARVSFRGLPPRDGFGRPVPPGRE